MKAVTYSEYAPDDNYAKILKVQDIDDPKPKADEVVFEVKSAALNYNDIWGMRGVPVLYHYHTFQVLMPPVMLLPLVRMLKILKLEIK